MSKRIGIACAVLLSTASASTAAAGVRPLEASPVDPAPAAAPAPHRTGAQAVADVAFRVAHGGAGRCRSRGPASGLTFQHLGQFDAGDRAAVLRERRLDLGPAILAVAAGSPAERAGFQAGDVVLAIAGSPAPPAPASATHFDQAAAQDHSDALDAVLRDALAGPAPVVLTVLRDGARHELTLSGVPACLSRVHLARSAKANAFADGTHVFVTTGLMRSVRSDDELAFILAHELAHNDLAHAARLRAEGVPRNFTRVLGRNGRLLRGTERDADRLGIALMRDAGYDPAAALAFLARIDRGPSLAFLSAHDGARSRRRLIGELLRATPDPAPPAP